jgi:hypothetical protein
VIAACVACGELPDWSNIVLNGEGGETGGADNGSGGEDNTGNTGNTNTGNTTSSGGTGAGPSEGGNGPGSGGTTSAGGVAQGGIPNVGGAGPNQAELDKQELATALAKLNTFIYANPCKFGEGGKDVSTLSGCNTSDVCFATSTFGQFKEQKQIAIGGVSPHVYEVEVNALGVIEPRDYPSDCIRLPGQPATAAMAECADGFANKGSVTFNIWELAIPDPARKVYFNSVLAHPPHRVDRVDNKFTIQVKAGTTLTFTFDDLNGGEIRNCTNIVAKSQYKTADGKTITASSTIAQPYNGNWLQLTVMNSKIVSR